MHRSQYGEEYQQTGEAMKRFSVAIMLLFASTAFAVDIAAIRAKAEAGNLAAMTTMGSLYHHGYGVQRDDAQALQWYLLAATHGHAGAQTITGMMLLQVEDVGGAKYWLRRAMAQGDATAQRQLDLLKK